MYLLILSVQLNIVLLFQIGRKFYLNICYCFFHWENYNLKQSEILFISRH